MGRVLRITRRYVRSSRRLLRMHWMIRIQLYSIPAMIGLLLLAVSFYQLMLWALSFESVRQQIPPAVRLWTFVTPPVAIVLGVVFSTALHIWLGWRAKKVLAHHRGSLCPRCLHDLRATPESSRCPECGTRYCRPWLRKLWRQAILLTGGRRAAQRVDGLFETQPPSETNQNERSNPALMAPEPPIFPTPPRPPRPSAISALNPKPFQPPDPR